jgi:hypothetical protein
MRLLTVHVNTDGVGVAGSRTLAHWVDPDPGQRDHGGGRAGQSQPAGHLTVYSLVRGPWELRLTRVDGLADRVEAAALRLRIGGWALAGDATAAFGGSVAAVSGAGLTSWLESVHGGGTAGATAVPHGGPLPGGLVVPWLDYAVRPGAWVATFTELSGGAAVTARQACQAVADVDAGGLLVEVDWPDGISTATRLDTEHARPAVGRPGGSAGPSGPLT